MQCRRKDSGIRSGRLAGPEARRNSSVTTTTDAGNNISRKEMSVAGCGSHGVINPIRTGDACELYRMEFRRIEADCVS